MGAVWLAGLVLFVGGLVWLACRFAAHASPPPPHTSVRACGGLVRVFPAWWAELDGWRDELDGGTP